MQIQLKAIAQNDTFERIPHFSSEKDSIAFNQTLQTIFKPYALLPVLPQNYFSIKPLRDIPNVKQIKLVAQYDNSVYFWCLVVLIILTASIRLLNTQRYQETLLQAFDSNWFEKNRDRMNNNLLTSWLVYLNFVLVASYIVSIYLQQNRHIYINNFIKLWLISSLSLTTLYLSKFIFHMLLGSLLQMKEVSDLVIRNTISVHNFLTLFFLPFAMLYSFENNPEIKLVYEDTLRWLFLLAIIYRLFKSIFNGLKISRIPIMYIFVYLCALEIIPWLILFKILNSYSS